MLSVPILVGKVKFCVEENPEEKQKPNGTGPQVGSVDEGRWEWETKFSTDSGSK